MSLLVEYTVNPGMAGAQDDALKALIDGLRAEGCEGFSYAAYATDDPTRYIGLLEFDDDAGKQAFLATKAFAAYRDGSKQRFPHPPSTTQIKKVASTRD